MYEYQPVCIGTALMYVHVLIEVQVCLSTGLPMGGAPYKYVKERGCVLFQLCHICPPCV